MVWKLERDVGSREDHFMMVILKIIFACWCKWLGKRKDTDAGERWENCWSVELEWVKENRTERITRWLTAVKSVEGSFIVVVPWAQLQTPEEMGWLELLKCFFSDCSHFSVKKENRLSSDNEDWKDMLQVWRESRKSGMWESGNRPGKYIVINGQREEPLSSVILYLKWDQQGCFICSVVFLCHLQSLPGHRQCLCLTEYTGLALT